MFGYVRPLKPDLLIREYSRYRSVYCGLCKQISREYGQAARLTLGYDLTLLALLLLSLSVSQPEVSQESCVLNPVRKKPVAGEHPVLQLCAGLSVLLVWHKAADDIQDRQYFRGRGVQAILGRAYRRAKLKYPGYDQTIRNCLQELGECEKGAPDIQAAAVFGKLLQQVFELAAQDALSVPGFKHHEAIYLAVGLFGWHLGNWIYLVDAIDDFAADSDNQRWNPFGGLTDQAAKSAALNKLQEHELELDRTAALLPYQVDSGLLSNIVTKGLAAVRQQIMAGQPLQRI